MASPNVCGILALYLQAYPEADRTQVRHWLETRGTVGVGTFYQRYIYT